MAHGTKFDLTLDSEEGDKNGSKMWVVGFLNEN